jgi:hypothetical protein
MVIQIRDLVSHLRTPLRWAFRTLLLAVLAGFPGAAGAVVANNDSTMTPEKLKKAGYKCEVYSLGTLICTKKGSRPTSAWAASARTRSTGAAAFRSSG